MYQFRSQSGATLVMSSSVHNPDRFDTSSSKKDDTPPASNATFVLAPSRQTSVVTSAAATDAAIPATRAIPTLNATAGPVPAIAFTPP